MCSGRSARLKLTQHDPHIALRAQDVLFEQGTGAGLVAADSPGAGELCPQPRLTHGRSGPMLLDELTGGADPSGRSLVVEETEPVLGPWLAALGQRLAVVRPDHHVFGTAASIAAGITLIDTLRQHLDP